MSNRFPTAAVPSEDLQKYTKTSDVGVYCSTRCTILCTREKMFIYLSITTRYVRKILNNLVLLMKAYEHNDVECHEEVRLAKLG